MNTEEQLQFHSQVLSGHGGTLDALMATVVALVAAVKDIPAVRQEVERTLERHYSDHLARSVNPKFMHDFEIARDYILGKQ